MPRYVALLRAINVGGHTVTMDRLRTLFGEFGLTDVSTVIASGNVIFDVAGRGSATVLEPRIAAHLERSLGFPVATFLRTPEELAAVAGRQSFPPKALASAGARLYVGFLPSQPPPAVRRRVPQLRTPTDDLRIDGREVYWLCRVPVHESAVSNAVLEKTLGMSVTVRNVTTVRKLAERSAQSSS